MPGPGGAWSWGVPGPRGVPGLRGYLVGGVPHPGGCLVPGGAWSRAVPGPGGGVPGPGVCLVETPPGRQLLQVVRILLECILVFIV